MRPFWSGFWYGLSLMWIRDGLCRRQGGAAGAAPAHTDHPLRHYDRTCPACQEECRRDISGNWSDAGAAPSGWDTIVSSRTAVEQAISDAKQDKPWRAASKAAGRGGAGREAEAGRTELSAEITTNAPAPAAPAWAEEINALYSHWKSDKFYIAVRERWPDIYRSLRPGCVSVPRMGKYRLVYNKATRKIDKVSNFDGLAVESFDPPEQYDGLAASGRKRK